MPAAIPIAVAAISAAGTAGAAAASSSGGPTRPSTHSVPAPLFEQALAHYYVSTLARNMLNQPPSFASYVQSGGTETFPISSPGLTPRQSQRLGLVGPRGQQIAYTQPSQTSLTPEQQLYLGYQQFLGGNKTGQLSRAYQINKHIGKLEGREQTPGRQAKEERLRGRRTRLLTGNVPTGLE